MIGIPFNPANCCFIASQSFNANQFDSSVPDSGNATIHNLLWDFTANSFIWVDAKTNLIVRELAGGGGGGAITNEGFSAFAAGPFDLNTTNQVFGGNSLLLPAGTYAIEAEFSYVADLAGAETAVIQIRSNTNQLLTGVDVTDVIEAERDTNPGVTPATVTQSAKCEILTFATPVIIKTAFQVLANAASVQNIVLRAILIK